MKNRSIALAIIFSIITCGIYTIYWFVQLNDDVNRAANTPGDTSGLMALVLNIVTCGIYGIYWAYKMGNKLDSCTAPASRGILYLILSIFGFGFINYILMQDTLNKI